MRKFGLLFSILILASQLALGQIAAWDFTGVGSTLLPTYAATTFNANLVSSSGANNITRGATATWSTGSNSFRTTGFQNNGISTSNTDYFQITLSSSTGYTLSLSTIDARFAGTATFAASPGVSNQFAYSLDGTNFTLIGSPSITIGTPATLSQIDLSGISTLQNVSAGTTITLRYYASGQTATGGWGFNSPSAGANGLAIGGTVTAVGGVADPTSFLATTASTTQINLSWAQNGNTDNVMVAWNSTNSFGIPSGSYSVNDPITGGGTVIHNGSGTSYNHTSLTSNTAYYYKAWSVDGSVVYSAGVTSNATTLKEEPTNHATVFSSVAGTPDYSAIELTWTDASTGTIPDSYLIKGSDVGYGSITLPADGTPEVNGALVRNVTQGTETYTFMGLSANTTYYFKIYPYTNSGSNINYKTDGTVPTTSLATGPAPPPSLLLEENFNFSGLLTDNSWSAHSGAGTNAIATTTGLTYQDYPSSGIGDAALLNNTGEDVNRTFTAQTTGFVYFSFLVNVTTGTAGYFIHVGTGATTFAARVFVQPSVNSGKINFGISNSGTAVFASTPTDYDPETTNYLLIVKYEVAAPTSNVSLWVISSGVPSTEAAAGTPEVTTTTGTGLASIDAIYLRQYIASQNITVDGIRVGTSWGFAPLPVELSSFSAVIVGNGVKLNWRTETEISNYGFEILRRVYPATGGTQDDIWNTLGFVQGHGNSNSPKDYSFTDDKVTGGNYSYRLKQIDTDGNFEYSKVIEVDLGSPAKFELSQNYPNPFNPTTTIRFSLPNSGNVKLLVYNLLGEQVVELVNGFKEAGIYTINFSAVGGSLPASRHGVSGGNASALPSGLYIYKIEANGFADSRKMLLVK